VLSVEGLTKSFDGFLAVKNVSFEVAEGEILGLIGPNGSGKSTTFNLIAGALAPSAGAVRIRGQDLAGLPAYRVAHAGIGRTHQIPKPFRKLSMLDNVALAAFYGQNQKLSRENAYAVARECLDLVNLRGERVDGLGAAGLKKLELARALATQPKLLLADESLGGLDHGEMEQAADLLAPGIRFRLGDGPNRPRLHTRSGLRGARHDETRYFVRRTRNPPVRWSTR